MLEYSRDALAAPLRSLDEVLDAIVSGCFSPDETRSGYFRVEGDRKDPRHQLRAKTDRSTKPPTEGEAAGSDEAPDEPVASPLSSSSSDSSDDSDSSKTVCDGSDSDESSDSCRRCWSWRWS